MSKLAEDIAFASNELTPAWDHQRSARLLSSIRIRQRRRIRAQRAVVVAAAALVLGGSALALRSSPVQTARVQTPAAGEPAGLLAHAATSAANAATSEAAGSTLRDGHTIRLLDGSRAQLSGAQSELAIVHNDRDRVALRLIEGRAHFEVVPSVARTFEVEAAPYRVVVLGTVFDVQRHAGSVQVSVARGRVRVYGPQGAEDLHAGQVKRFGGEVSEVDGASLEASQEPPLEATDELAGSEPAGPSRAVKRAHGRAAGPSWRSLTQSGDYDAAFASLKRSATVHNDPSELMDAADAARLSGHPMEAVAYLERVVDGHRQSPVAPLAAFTLGREYLDRLGQPHKAATAFELARKLAPSGSLAQDALAREVEAWSKGGNAEKAYLRAREYLQAYPNGRRLRAVQLYGGLQ